MSQPERNEPTGQEMARWRKYILGMSQSELAAILGLNQQTISKIETSTDPVHPRLRLACAAIALGVRDFDFSPSMTLDIRRVAVPKRLK